MSGRGSKITDPLVEPLTRREREVLNLLDQDLSVRQMAEKLIIALSSTKWHIQQIYGKLGVNNRRQAIQRARELGLLHSESPSQPVFHTSETWQGEPVPTENGFAFPAPHTQPGSQHNLPAQLTRFIGREAQIAEICQLVIERRLVTLTGSGGVGKTRLSLEVSQGVLAAFRDGAWFIDLTPLSDPELIPGAVLSALDLRNTPDAKKGEQDLLVQVLQAKSLLLILDNCEHLVEACARLAEKLLQRCPDLHILATSREALHIAGEESYRVPSMELPDPDHLPPIPELSRYEAVQLFVERGQSAEHTFKLTERNAQAVAQICRRMDGMPLAIELAAARLNVLAPEQIITRLDNAFHLLSSGSRTALPRHQTLRAAIEWSYNLLHEQEKACFRRLAVFRGGWSLEAADATCSGEGIQAGEVLDLLAHLVDKSLVVKEEKEGRARFRMLEIIRQFAEHQFYAAEHDVKEVRDRHRDWYLKFAEEAIPHLGTGEQVVWLNRLEMEHDNLRAALHWSLEQKQAEPALHLVSSLAGFWNMHSYNEEAYRWTQLTLDLAENDPVARQSSLWAFATLGFFSHVLTTGRDIAAILPRMEEACQVCLQQGDWEIAGGALKDIGIAEANLGHWEAAERYFRQGLEITKPYEDSSLYSFLLLCEGVAVAVHGNYFASREYYRQSLELLPRHGDRQITLFTLLFYSEDLFLQGQLNAALELSLRALEEAEAVGYRHALPRCLTNLTRIAWIQGDFARAPEWAWKTYRMEKELGGSGQSTLVILGVIDLHANQLEAAHAKFLEALNLARREKDLYELFYTRFKASLNLGRVELKRSNLIHARKYIDDAQQLYPEIVWFKDDARHLLAQTLAHAARLDGQCMEARGLYQENLRQMAAALHYLYTPESLEGLAMVEIEQDQFPLAARLFGAAQGQRERMGTPLPPYLQGEYGAYQARLRQGLAQEELERLWNEGREMVVEEAITEACELEDS